MTDENADHDSMLDDMVQDATTAYEAESPAFEAKPQPEEPSSGQERDELGRFRAKEPENDREEQAEPGAQQEEPVEQKGKAIPPYRLREETQKRQEAEARAAQLEGQIQLLSQQMQMLMRGGALPQQQPAQEAASDPIEAFYSDPGKYIAQQVNPIVSEVREGLVVMSRQLAEQRFGAEKVNTAYQALDQAIKSGAVNPSAADYLRRQSPDPFGEIIKWHEQYEMTANPQAYREKLKQELLAELQAQKPQQPETPPKGVVSLPPSLNRARSAQASPAMQGMGASRGGFLSEQDAAAYMQQI